MSKVLAETHLMVLPKERFDRLLRDYPDLSRNFVREMRGWLIKDQEIIEEEANAVFRASRVSWFDFLLVIGVSVLLAITFNISNPYGIPLIPERPDQVCPFDQRRLRRWKTTGRDKLSLWTPCPNNFYQ